MVDYSSHLQESRCDKMPGRGFRLSGEWPVTCFNPNRLGIPATVYLPATASADRVARVAMWGAKVVQVGQAWDDAHAEIQKEQIERNLQFAKAADEVKAGGNVQRGYVRDVRPELQ